MGARASSVNRGSCSWFDSSWALPSSKCSFALMGERHPTQWIMPSQQAWLIDSVPPLRRQDWRALFRCGESWQCTEIARCRFAGRPMLRRHLR